MMEGLSDFLDSKVMKSVNELVRHWGLRRGELIHYNLGHASTQLAARVQRATGMDGAHQHLDSRAHARAQVLAIPHLFDSGGGGRRQGPSALSRCG